MKKLLLAFILFQSSFILCSAQQANLPDRQAGLDSLYSVWQDETQPDSTRVEAYKNYIAKGVFFSNPDSAVVLAEDFHRYAKEHNYPKAAAQGYVFQGNAKMYQGNYPSALKDYEKSIAIYEEIGDKQGIAKGLSNIGNIYYSQGNYPRALEYYEESLAIFEEIGDKRSIPLIENNIGSIYLNHRNFPLAMEYFKKSLAYCEEIGDKRGIATGLANIGSIYKDQDN